MYTIHAYFTKRKFFKNSEKDILISTSILKKDIYSLKYVSSFIAKSGNSAPSKFTLNTMTNNRKINEVDIALALIYITLNR